jgi:hypothetical protein
MAAQARLDLGQGHRRAVGRQDDAFAVLDQGGQGRQQLFLGRGLAADELDVIDQQHVGAAQAFLEGGGRTVLHGAHEGRQEAFGGQIDDLRIRAQALGLPGDGVQQVGLAVAIGAAEEDRVEMAVGPAGGLAGDGQGEGIALALDEAVEGQTVLQAGGAHGAGPVCHRSHSRARHRHHGGRFTAGGADGRGGRGRAHLGAAADVEATRQAVEAQPQFVHATQGVLAHPVTGIGGRGHQDELARAVDAHGRRRDVGAERTFTDFGTKTTRRLGPDAIRIRHARHCHAPRHISHPPNKIQQQTALQTRQNRGRLLLPRKA